jgi:hypothetical protein
VVNDMSKQQGEKIQRNSEISLSDGRTPEREALAAAIALRDATAAQTASVVQARARAASDRFAAARAVEEAERALTLARETSRAQLVDAYMSGEDVDDRDIADAEWELAKAQRRLADLSTIADGLSAHERQPGHSIPATKVTAAVRAVVQACPSVRRLAQDFAVAQRAFREYEATLIWLAGLGCIPDDLQDNAPKAHHTRWAEPADEWVRAIEALKRDADAELPA